MTTSTMFDDYQQRIEAGQRLSADEIRALATTADILPLGMLADTLRRRLHGTRATFLRVATCAFDQAFTDAVSPAAREVRITGAPPSLDVAVAAVRSARAIAGERTVSGFSWSDVERLGGSAEKRGEVLAALRDGGLDAIGLLPLDSMADPAAAIAALRRAGFERLCLTIDKAPAADRVAMLLAVSEMQEQFGSIQAVNPLPMILNPLRPTTGYDDVKMVAVARLAAPDVPTVQVDWMRYGPKLAQVALTFGADDIYGVSASDDASEGRRRAPLEDIRRNVQAAGFEPFERDGNYQTSSD